MLKRVQHDKLGGEIPTRAKRTGEANEFGMTKSIEMLTRAKRTGEANEFGMTRMVRYFDPVQLGKIKQYKDKLPLYQESFRAENLEIKYITTLS